MKKSQLILAAAALVALASCSNEGYTPSSSLENEIGFNAVARKATRANNTIFTSSVYDTLTNNTFQVWGWQSESGNFTTSELAEDAASNFMTNLTISWTSGRDNSRAKAWRNAQNYYYWPFTGKISFLAIHPSTVAPSSTGWDATNKKPQATFADYTISASNKTTDLMLANSQGARQADPLNMVFSHALSQIEVQVKTDQDYSADVAFDVESVTFHNIDLSGDLAYTNGAFNWTDNDTQTEDWVYCNTVKEDITKDYQVYGAANVMIPQPAYYVLDTTVDPAIVTDQTTITIGYSMEQTNSAKITGTVTIGKPQVWEAGRKYVYTINFRLNEILFNPTVTNWVDVNVETINIY